MDCGGAIYFKLSQHATLINCVFQENVANISGGAVYTLSYLSYKKQFMTDITYMNNRASMYGGAAVHKGQEQQLQVYYIGLKAVNNKAEKGGALHVEKISILNLTSSAERVIHCLLTIEQV